MKIVSNKKDILIILITVPIIFCLAVLVWYSPTLFKGYNSNTTASDALVRAKNYAITGKYASENTLNIILSSQLISTQGIQSSYGNKLGTILYGYLIKIFKISSNNLVVLTNSIILALALLIFSLTTYYLFGFKISLFFSLIYIFLPSNWQLPQLLVGYEFALLFLSLFFLFFSLSGYHQKITFILSGIFLILACLCREAFFLILPILFIFLLVLKLKKLNLVLKSSLTYIFIPVIIIWSIFWLPDFISGQNTYLLFFSSQGQEALKRSDYAYYSHLFPDPYTYHFNQERFLSEKFEISKVDLMSRLGQEKVLVNMGQQSVNLWQRIKIGTPLFLRHIFRFFSITEIGGPFIFLLFFLGLFVLKNNPPLVAFKSRFNKSPLSNYWFSFYLSLILGSTFLLAYVNLAGRNHLMDFGWMIGVCVSLGLVFMAKSFYCGANINSTKKWVEIFLLLIVIYNLILNSHVMWGQIYDKSSIPLLTAYAKEINNLGIKPDQVIAVPFESAGDAYNLNFQTDKSIVVFQNKTIEQLLDQQKLTEVFDKFGIKYILGYSPGLSEKIINQTQIEIIADSSLLLRKEDLKMNNKNWFLNLVK